MTTGAEKAAKLKRDAAIREAQENKFKRLRKFSELIEDINSRTVIQTPIRLVGHPKYKKFRNANIVKLDHDRYQIIDFLLTTLYKVYLLLQDRHWQEAFLTVYANLTVGELFNEFIIVSKHTMLIVYLLQKMEIKDKAMLTLEYLRDVVEDTNNNAEAIQVYTELGKVYQEEKEYKMALKAFKRML